MNATERQNKLISLVENFLQGKINALNFHNQYLKVWRTKVTEIDSGYRKYKNGILLGIFFCCDIYCEPEFREGGGDYYDDEQFKQAVSL